MRWRWRGFVKSMTYVRWNMTYWCFFTIIQNTIRRADIVRIRKSTKSHVSTSLKVLEDRGLIERRVDPANKKRVTIHLLQMANEVIEDGKWAQKRVCAKTMFDGLTEEEIKVFMNVFQKVYDQCSKDDFKWVKIIIKLNAGFNGSYFDACYLIFDLIAGILFFVYSKGNPLFILYGVLTLTLCGGDAFH